MAGDENGGENGEDGAVARRLRVLGAVCASLLVAVLATAAAIGWSAARPGAGDLMESPPADSFMVALGAMLLVLLASAVYGRILRRQATAELAEATAAEAAEAREEPAAARKEAEERQEPEEARRQHMALAAARLRAYSWATGASFGMLAVAAALGAIVARSGKASLYGLVICIAALFSMTARWPRRSGFDLALRSDRSDAVSRAAAWRNLAQPFASPAAGAGAGEAASEAVSEAAGERAGGGAPEAPAGSGPSGAAGGDGDRRRRPS